MPLPFAPACAERPVVWALRPSALPFPLSFPWLLPLAFAFPFGLVWPTKALVLVLAPNCETLPACCDADDVAGVAACVLPGVGVVNAARNAELASDGTVDDAVVAVLDGAVDPMSEVVDEIVDEVVDVVLEDVAFVAAADSVAVDDRIVLKGVLLESGAGPSPRSARRKSAARDSRLAVAPPVSNREDMDRGASRAALPARGNAD